MKKLKTPSKKILNFSDYAKAYKLYKRHSDVVVLSAKRINQICTEFQLSITVDPIKNLLILHNDECLVELQEVN